MTRPTLLKLTAGAALLATGFGLSLAVSEAEAKDPVVVCQQVKQSATAVDEQMVAEFMSEQLMAGRARFQTVRGLTTVICAY